MRRIMTLTVNDKRHEPAVAANETLAAVPRDKTGLTGTKLQKTERSSLLI